MAPLSAFDLFKIGVGPSSSHTLGPWRAAERFVGALRADDALSCVRSVQVDLYGSLAKTGIGHGTGLALVMGLSGADPETCDTSRLQGFFAEVKRTGVLDLGGHAIGFEPRRDIRFEREQTLPAHPNALKITADLSSGRVIASTYYSVGGGFIEQEGRREERPGDPQEVPFSMQNADSLLAQCRAHRVTIPDLMRSNELSLGSEARLASGLLRIWETMVDCVHRGCVTEGKLPGGLDVSRRAAGISRRLMGGRTFAARGDWLEAVRRARTELASSLLWLSAFALAVNEENAAFGRVVTAPTNGAAGVIPAVLLHHELFGGAGPRDYEAFLLTAAAVGMLFKQGATISAAQGGCQAEVGVSSAMAAAGLCQVLGGSPERVLMAAEIAMEHHLGLTCDPVGGLVQVPCIERNTMGAVKALTACHLALESDPARAKVSLDTAIRTMWATAQDMGTKYKETSEGGLALLIPVNVSEC